MKKQKYIWIVEIKFDGYSTWEPTVGAGVTRRDAMRVMNDDWRRDDKSGDKFRVRKYAPVGDACGLRRDK